MHPPEPAIVVQRFTEAHLEGVAAPYDGRFVDTLSMARLRASA
jgi:hypothetical protein